MILALVSPQEERASGVPKGDWQMYHPDRELNEVFRIGIGGKEGFRAGSILNQLTFGNSEMGTELNGCQGTQCAFLHRSECALQNSLQHK